MEIYKKQTNKQKNGSHVISNESGKKNKKKKNTREIII